uniref:Like Sm ribonucleoprotein core n=1 Tax=Echinococcus granulosus TaxID=6210 RepID=A0A068WSG8_ECHGR|nr:Like Sm ribonucleoprotein core [Echinococcus granulosus]
MSSDGRRVMCDLTNRSRESVSEIPLKRTKKQKFGSILDYWGRLERKLDHSMTLEGVLGPMERLMQAMHDSAAVYVVTRGMREIRAILTGRMVAFDRYWNLILADVTEYKTVAYPKLQSNEGPGRRRRRRRRRIQQVMERMAQRNHSVSSRESEIMPSESPRLDVENEKQTASTQFDDPTGFNAVLEPVCNRYGQLFIRGANIVFVRILPTAATTEMCDK